MTAIRINSFDGALLDLDLNGESILPAASELETRGVPFIVATGQQRSNRLPATLAQAPFLTKPYQIPELEGLVRKTFSLEQGA